MAFFSKPKLETIQDAKIFFNKGNYKKTLKVCKNFLAQNPDNFEALNLMGDAYNKLNDKNNALDTFRKVINYLETEKFTDRAIAVIKKVIRLFPDQYDLYRKLSKLFEAKNLKAEQLKILYELSEIYHSNGLEDKAIDILKEIVEVDRENLPNYVEIITKFDELGKKFEISKILYPALELAYKKQDQSTIDFFVEIAIKNKIDFKDAIKFTASYFEKNKDSIEIFNKYAKEVLSTDFDEHLFRELIRLNNYSAISDFIFSIKDKYKETVIFDYLLNQAVLSEDITIFKKLLNEINTLPEYDFSAAYADIIGRHVDEIVDEEALDLMVTIAGKCSAKDLQISIYKKLSSIYKSKNEDEKAQRYIQYINELEYKDIGVTAETSIEDIDDNDDVKEDDSLSDLFETTAHSEDEDSFDLNFDDEDDGSIKEDMEEFDLSLDLDEPEVSENETKEIITEEKNTDFELDLDDYEDDTVSGNDEETTSLDFDDLPEEADVFGKTNDEISNNELKTIEDDDFELDLDDYSDDKSEEKSKNESLDLTFEDLPDESDVFNSLEIEEVNDSEAVKDVDIKNIEKLIENKKLEKAKLEISKLLEKYPNNAMLKELSSKIILLSTKSDSKDDILDISSDFENVVEGIRKSIDAQVSLEDYETHYDLAMAYMEMELYDEAIEELKKSATGNKKYESLFLMAECYKRMKQYEDSIGIHKLIIIDFKDQDKMKNSLYEIAMISEMQNDTNNSINFLQKISRLDPNFRDVRERLSGKSQTSNLFDEEDKFEVIESANEESSVKKKKKKISFL